MNQIQKGWKIAVLHTSMAVLQIIGDKIKEELPDSRIYNLIDDQMLSDVMENGGATKETKRRLFSLLQAAETIRADIILNACSSVGGCFDEISSLTSIPCVRIDQAMAEEAVESGKRIAVYGSVSTTMIPSCQLIERIAAERGKEVEVTPYLIEDAFRVLTEDKDKKRHNRMVTDKIYKTHERYDVLVLAQASMSVVIPELSGIDKKILYSTDSGIRKLKEMLENGDRVLSVY